MIEKLINIPRIGKQGLVLLADSTICFLSVWISFYLRLGYFTFDEFTMLAIFISLIIALPLFIFSGLYLSIFRYAGWPTLYLIFKIIILYCIFFTSIITVIGIQGIPRTIGIIQPIVLLFGIFCLRIIINKLLSSTNKNSLIKSQIPNVLVYGAGKAGIQLVAALDSSNEMNVKGYIDDNLKLQGQKLNEKQIHSPINLEAIIEGKKISHIFLAMPSASRKKRKKIIDKLAPLNTIIRTLPSIGDLTSGKISFSDIQDLDIEDLLVRDVVEPSHELLTKDISNKIVAITGAGGSIGSELCRQIINCEPKKILLLETNEYSLYTIHSELLKNRKMYNNSKKIEIIPLLASVQDKTRLVEIFKTWGPDTIYHAAAYKHVPLVEYNLIEGIQNNVIGTIKLVQTAIEFDISNFVMISTDKAVRPTNAMGASKRLAEICLQSLFEYYQADKKINISMVRFGNVLDSSGSVIPLFRKQIIEGGPITITDPKITRYFMTVKEAAQLVIQAGAMARGGDVFVLDMGEPVKIIDLAKRMISLSGFSIQDSNNPDGDIKISYIGLRPGEKLYEEPLIGNNPQITNHSKILKAQDPFIKWNNLKNQINLLDEVLLKRDIPKIIDLLTDLIPEYKPSSKIVDYTFTEQKNLKN